MSVGALGPRSIVRDAVLVVHGGAGTILPENLTPQLDADCRAALRAALASGHKILASGGSALDATVAAVSCLEDDPHFNAGRGSVFTHDGRIEMDAALMRGSDRAAGAVTGVTTVKNPIRLAHAVLQNSPFVFLSGDGAEEFGREWAIETVDPEYFRTDDRWRQLEAARARGEVSISEDNKFGTVGAVARDRDGHLAAATSTGGLTNKRYGRIGDTPVLGAGTWADDATCAVSATGHGEFFLRCAAAHDIASRIAYGGAALADAAVAVVHGSLKRMGGDGGVIAIDSRGTAALPFNTTGMYRGVVTAAGEIAVAIYDER